MSEKLEGPIVLLIGCPHDTRARLHLLDVQIIEAYGQTPEIIEVAFGEGLLYWVDPERTESMHRLLDYMPSKSKNAALKWIETDGFVRDIRKWLTGMIHDATSLESLPKNWQELVTLVVIDQSLNPMDSLYTQRVFDGWFPSAKYREYGYTIGGRPLWRNAEVTRLEERSVNFETVATGDLKEVLEIKA